MGERERRLGDRLGQLGGDAAGAAERRLRCTLPEPTQPELPGQLDTCRPFCD